MPWLPPKTVSYSPFTFSLILFPSSFMWFLDTTDTIFFVYFCYMFQILAFIYYTLVLVRYYFITIVSLFALYGKSSEWLRQNEPPYRKKIWHLKCLYGVNDNSPLQRNNIVDVILPMPKSAEQHGKSQYIVFFSSSANRNRESLLLSHKLWLLQRNKSKIHSNVQRNVEEKMQVCSRNRTRRRH